MSPTDVLNQWARETKAGHVDSANELLSTQSIKVTDAEGKPFRDILYNASVDLFPLKHSRESIVGENAIVEFVGKNDSRGKFILKMERGNWRLDIAGDFDALKTFGEWLKETLKEPAVKIPFD